MPAIFLSFLVLEREGENGTPLVNGFLTLCVAGLKGTLDIVKGF